MKFTFLEKKLKPGISELINKQRWELEISSKGIFTSHQNEYFSHPDDWRCNGEYYDFHWSSSWSKPKYESHYYDGNHQSYQIGPFIFSWCH